MEGSLEFLTVLLVPIIFASILIAPAIKILPEYERGVIFRLGRLMGVSGPGIFFVIPIVDRLVRVDLRVTNLDLPPQLYLTRDRIKVNAGATIYYQVFDPEQAVVSVEDFRQATLEVAQISLGNVVGQRELDELLAHRDQVNEQLRDIIDQQTESWGVRVSRVEIKDVALL